MSTKILSLIDQTKDSLVGGDNADHIILVFSSREETMIMHHKFIIYKELKNPLHINREIFC